MAADAGARAHALLQETGPMEAASSRADFVIDRLSDGTLGVRAVRHDGLYGRVVATAPALDPDGDTDAPSEHLLRVQQRCRDALRAGETWAASLVEVSTGQLRDPG